MLLVFASSAVPTRRKLASAGVVIGVLAAIYAGVWVASQTSEVLRDRAHGVLSPLSDESVQLRFETWRLNLDEAADHPLGQGIGVVGAASTSDTAQQRTTDNSFLKVMVEQGVLGLLLFAAGLIGMVVLVASRLRVAPDESRPPGVAALAGFVAFLGIGLAGEAVEQPGKVVAWALFGMALAHAYSVSPGAEAAP